MTINLDLGTSMVEASGLMIYSLSGVLNPITVQPVLFLKSRSITDVKKELNIEKYFDKETMSIHLKQGSVTYLKKGKPGKVEFIKYSDDKTSKKLLMEYADEILEKADYFPDTFIEIDRKLFNMKIKELL